MIGIGEATIIVEERENKSVGILNIVTKYSLIITKHCLRRFVILCRKLCAWL